MTNEKLQIFQNSVNLSSCRTLTSNYFVRRMKGAFKNDQEHQTINQECSKCSAKISICWSAPHDGSLSGAEDVRILSAPPPKTSTLPQLDEPQHNSRCTQTETAQAPIQNTTHNPRVEFFCQTSCLWQSNKKTKRRWIGLRKHPDDLRWTTIGKPPKKIGKVKKIS